MILTAALVIIAFAFGIIVGAGGIVLWIVGKMVAEASEGRNI